MAKKRTAAGMARFVAQWRESGESGARFARRHHIPTRTFWYWCRKLAARPAAAPAFVPVQVAPDVEAPAIEVVFSYLKDVLLRVATHPQRLIHQLTPKGWADTFQRRAAA